MTKTLGSIKRSLFRTFENLHFEFISCFVLRISDLQDFILGQQKCNRQRLPTPMVRSEKGQYGYWRSLWSDSRVNVHRRVLWVLQKLRCAFQNQGGGWTDKNVFSRTFHASRWGQGPHLPLPWWKPFRRWLLNLPCQAAHMPSLRHISQLSVQSGSQAVGPFTRRCRGGDLPPLQKKLLLINGGDPP